MYRERPAAIAGAVTWSVEPAEGPPGTVLPDGCMDLLWLHGRLVLAGPDTAAHAGDTTDPRPVHGLRFAPGTLPPLLGVPAHAVRDRRVPLDEVWAPAEVRVLEQRLAEAADPGRELERIAAARRAEAPPVDRAVPAVVAAVRGGLPVATIADQVGLSARQLHRRSLDAFGYGTKVLARVLRLQHALALAGAGRGFAVVAVEAGYADQAHLARDARALTGRTFGDLARRET